MPIRSTPQPADRQAVERLTRATEFFRDDETAVALELIDECLQHGTDSGYHLALLDAPHTPDNPQDVLVGFAIFGPIPCSTWSFDLYWIVVDPTRQNQGFGRQLAEYCESHTRSLGGRRLYIETSSQPLYQPTRQFYERLGYHLEATLPEFYGPGDDKLIYAKTLPDA